MTRKRARRVEAPDAAEASNGAQDSTRGGSVSPAARSHTPARASVTKTGASGTKSGGASDAADRTPSLMSYLVPIANASSVSAPVRGPRFALREAAHTPAQGRTEAIADKAGQPGAVVEERYAEVDLTSLPPEFWAPVVPNAGLTGGAHTHPTTTPDDAPRAHARKPVVSALQAVLASLQAQRHLVSRCAPAPRAPASDRVCVCFDALRARARARAVEPEGVQEAEPALDDDVDMPDAAPASSAAPPSLSPSASPAWESAYTVHLRSQLLNMHNVLASSGSLQSSELTLLTASLGLSSRALGVLARVFMRKGPWFRTVTLQRYEELAQGWTHSFSARLAPDVAQRVLSDAVRELVAAGLLLPLPSMPLPNHAPCEAVEAQQMLLLEAADALCTTVEARAVLDSLQVKVPSGARASTGAQGPASGGGPTRAELMQLLRRAVTTQRSVWGGALPLGKALSQVLRAPGLAADHVCVRMHPRTIALLRRAHSLFYVATATAHLSSGMGTGSWQTAVDMDAEFAALACSHLHVAVGRDSCPIDLASSPLRKRPAAVPESGAARRAAWFEDVALPVYELCADFARERAAAVVPQPDAPDTIVLLTQSPLREPEEFDGEGDAEDARSAKAQSNEAAHAARQRRAWGPGSGSKYADPAAGMDTYLPLGVGAGAGHADAMRGKTAAYRGGGFAASFDVARIGGGLFSPGLLDAFKKLAFATYTLSPVPVHLFRPPLLQCFEAAHLFRAQADYAGVYAEPVDGSEADEEQELIGDTTPAAVEQLQLASYLETEPAAAAECDAELRGPALAGLALLPFAPLLVAVPLPQWLHHVGKRWSSDADDRQLLRDAVSLALVHHADTGTPPTCLRAACNATDVGLASLLVLLYRAFPHLVTSLEDEETVSHWRRACWSWSRPERLRACGRYISGVSAVTAAAYRASLCLALSDFMYARLVMPPARMRSVERQLTAGSVFATLVWEAVDPLERARLYSSSSALLCQLVQTAYNVHRSGRWWGRLSLDISHLGLPHDAYRVTQTALASPDVRAGDRLDLYLRARRLRRKLGLAAPMSTALARTSAAAVQTSAPEVTPGTLSGVLMNPMLVPIDVDDEEVEDAQAVPGGMRTGQGLRHDVVADADDGDTAEPEAQDRDMQTCLSQCEGVVVAAPGASSEKSQYASVPNLSGIYEAAAARRRPVHPSELRTDSFVRSPLNRSTSERSRFVSSLDAFNDSQLAVPLDNVTDAACESFGMSWPECPGRVVFRAAEAFSTSSAPMRAADASPAAASNATEEPAQLSRDTGRVTVEQLALQHYYTTWGGWRGVHCEGSPLRCIFVLLMWEVLFQDVPGVFLTPYQDAPLDLDSPVEFYATRRGAIIERCEAMAQWSREEIMGALQGCWERQYGRVCRAMRWDAWPLGLLQLIAVGLGGPALAVVCDAMCFDFRHLSGGMPDLLLWRVRRVAAASASDMTVHAAEVDAGERSRVDVRTGVDEHAVPPALATPLAVGDSETGRQSNDDNDPLLRLLHGCDVDVAFVEVKGPRDRLSEKQHVWLHVLCQAGIDARVCKITEPREPRTRRGGGRRSGGDASAGGVFEGNTSLRTAPGDTTPGRAVPRGSALVGTAAEGAMPADEDAPRVSIRLRVVGDEG